LLFSRLIVPAIGNPLCGPDRDPFGGWLPLLDRQGWLAEKIPARKKSGPRYFVRMSLPDAVTCSR
jgi:hypothetical protein